jgi:predicted nucleic acid-binding protein
MMEVSVSTWLIDTALIKLIASPRAPPQRWCEANDASLFLSAASLTEIAGSIDKMPSSQSQRVHALRHWLNGIAESFADRVHSVDPAIAMRAGAFLPRLKSNNTRHPLHDAILVATAQVHGHGLLTRREATFGTWTQTPIKMI